MLNHELEYAIFQIQDSSNFEKVCLEVFQYQYKHCEVYKNYCDHLNVTNVNSIKEIPFLPIQFFKTHKIIAQNLPEEIQFMSSGTGGNRSSHFVAKKAMYEKSFLPTFEHFVGPLDQTAIFGLLPNYTAQGHSSLIYMVEKLIQHSNCSLSGFYLEDYPLLLSKIKVARSQNKKVILFGVSYALLDLAEMFVNLENVLIIETGGMKGRRKEMSKVELHEILKKGLNVDFISSEYGMCELLSQAYARADGLFEFPNWMRAMLREVNDPLTIQNGSKTGGINIIDLANLYSCSFIATQDLGRIKTNEKGFESLELMGRFDHSDIRGCNLLVQ